MSVRKHYLRPSVSPVLTGLFACGVLRREQRVLDVGCGSGVDAVTLGAWGWEYVFGIDRSAVKIAQARRRATRCGVGEWVRFAVCDVSELRERCEQDFFDVVVDSLCWNNVHATSPHATPPFVRNLFWALKPGGMLILQSRTANHPLASVPGHKALPPSFDRYFELSNVVTTHFAESYGGAAAVGVCVGHRRVRPKSIPKKETA